MYFRSFHPASVRAYGAYFYPESSIERNHAIKEKNELYNCPIDEDRAWEWIRSNPLQIVNFFPEGDRDDIITVETVVKQAISLTQEK